MPLKGLVMALILLLVLSLALNGAQSLAAGSAPGIEAQRAARNTQRTITYTYDAAGRLVSADYGNDQSIAYAYDAAGNLVQRTAAGASYPAYLPVIMR